METPTGLIRLIRLDAWMKQALGWKPEQRPAEIRTGMNTIKKKKGNCHTLGTTGQRTNMHRRLQGHLLRLFVLHCRYLG